MTNKTVGDLDLVAGLIYALAGMRSDGVIVRGPIREHDGRWTAKVQMAGRDGEPYGEASITATVKPAAPGNRSVPTQVECQRALLREAYEQATRHRALLDGALTAAAKVLTAEEKEES